MVKVSPLFRFTLLDSIYGCERLKDTYDILKNLTNIIFLVDLAFCKGLCLGVAFKYA